MGYEIERRDSGAAEQVQPGDGLVRYLETKRDLVRELYARGASDLQFEHFLETCKARGLNPLAKQIYLVMRKQKVGDRWQDVPVIQTGIDGFRLVADRTGKYQGQVGPFWCGADGQWRDAWLDAESPAAAKVGVLRRDFAEPLWAVARFDAYAERMKDGELTRFWARMPDLMIAKCAEALALRKAFPEDLSGLVTSDEMGGEQVTPEPSGLPVDTTDLPAPKPHQRQAAPAEPAPPEKWRERYDRMVLNFHDLGDEATIIDLIRAAGLTTATDLDDDLKHATAVDMLRTERALRSGRDETPYQAPVSHLAFPQGGGEGMSEDEARGKLEADAVPEPAPAGAQEELAT